MIENDAITLTPAAISHVRSAIAKRGKGKGMRLAVKTSGCSGLAYVENFVEGDEDELAQDHTFAIDANLQLYVSTKHFPFLKGTQIDYVKQGLKAGFKYNNPNVAGSCGCGESFSV